MRTHSLIRTLSGGIALALILACGGGGGSSSDHHFPITASVSIECINQEAQPIHILLTGETYSQAGNQVAAHGTRTRNSTTTYTWADANDRRAFTVHAGRNGVDIATDGVTMVGSGRSNGQHIKAIWDGTTLVATVE